MDVLEGYINRKKFNNLSIIWISLMLALSINFFVINNSDIWNNLKTNLLENSAKEIISDLYLEKKSNSINLNTKNEIKDLINITLSIAYNPENVSINNLITKTNWVITNNSEFPGLTTIFIDFSEAQNLKKWDSIIEIETSKINNQTENINITSANFTDKDNNTFELSTSWIIF